MKNIYTLTISLLLFTSTVFAQSKNNTDLKLDEKRTKTTLLKNNNLENPSLDATKSIESELWSDNFADPNTWLIEHDAAITDLEWEIDTGLSNGGSFQTANIESTTADNGFAMIDSDEYANANGVEDCWFTNVTPIDLSDNDHVVLEFESWYRRFNNEECFLVISTNNTDWPDLDVNYDAASNPNVFLIWPGMATNESAPLNPTVKRFNISEIAGGQSTVWVRFNWTGTYGYSWFIDDVKILEQSANDMVMESVFFANNELENQYSRIPLSQVNDMVILGATSYNFGYESQTDVKTEMSLQDADENELLYVSSDLTPEVIPNDTIVFEDVESLPLLNIGLYSATFTVTSSEEQEGENFLNNTIVRNFEITNGVYSLDGIGVHSNANTNSLGTNSFTDGEDGLFIMTLYQLFQEENEVIGMEVLLHSSTVPGGFIVAHMMGEEDVLANNIDDPIISSEDILITQDHIDSGRVFLYFDEPEVLAASSYYAAVELFSLDGEFDIRIRDDVTVPQPLWSSAISLLSQTYTNGNAAAIRLLLSGIDAVSEIDIVTILGQNAPNPARDFTTFSFELLSSQNVTIRVTDNTGRAIYDNNLGNLNPGNHSYTIDLRGLQSGMYYYSIITDKSRISRAMQVIK